ncbi:MAG: hypothetical protein OSB09_02480 [Planctomycetota bacterium]|nr:hypothetical protein [Planctomycetota bacterium]
MSCCPSSPKRPLLLLCIFSIIGAITPVIHADLDYPDFLDMTGLTMVGSTTQFGDRVRLTPASIGLAGAVYTTDQIQVANGFDTTFTYEINPAAGGADGMVFILQNESPTSIYSNGGPLGYDGMINCVVVEIDTYVNGNFNDPPGPHLAIHGREGAANSADELAAGIAVDSTSANVGGLRTMRVSYAGGWFEVFLDDLLIPRMSVQLDLLGHLGSDSAWIGFIGSTGGISETHDVLSWFLTTDSGTQFIRGDVNDDSSVNLPDAIFALSALFVPGSNPATCLDSADINDDGSFNLPDAVFLLSALFVPGSSPIPDPVGNCDADPSDDTIDCELNNCP